MPAVGDVSVGDRLPERTVTVTQEIVLRYAGASGDFNPLHWDPEVARDVSPTGGVIAHGMLSLGLLSSVVTRWGGGAGVVESLKASFKAPCPVGATVTIGGEVTDITDDHRAELAVWVRTDDGAKVVDARGSRAVVRLTAPA